MNDISTSLEAVLGQIHQAVKSKDLAAYSKLVKADPAMPITQELWDQMLATPELVEQALTMGYPDPASINFLQAQEKNNKAYYIYYTFIKEDGEERVNLGIFKFEKDGDQWKNCYSQNYNLDFEKLPSLQENIEKINETIQQDPRFGF